jgi:hypothetical protein
VVWEGRSREAPPYPDPIFIGRGAPLYDFALQSILQLPNARTRWPTLSTQATTCRTSLPGTFPALFDHVQGAGTRGPKRACIASLPRSRSAALRGADGEVRISAKAMLCCWTHLTRGLRRLT